MDALNDFIVDIGDDFWTYVVLPVIACLGLYFTIRTVVVQGRYIPEMIRTLLDKTPTDSEGRPQSVSAFGAFTISAASRVGVGNIAGVGTAIATGGPGAIFWMWAMAFIGGATSFVESTLGQLYKRRSEDGFHGGPAYYMLHGLKSRGMGIAFSVVLIICFPFAFSALQANTITDTLTTTVETDSTAIKWVIGIVLAALVAVVVFGGVRRIAKVTQTIVPAMAGLYLLVGLVIIGMNIGQVPGAFADIFTEAFTIEAGFGGWFGTVVMIGVKRGMFSNEAGLGSAPNAGASAAVTHPVKQGLVQTLGVYFDTFLVCSITALIILVSNPDLSGATAGIGLTQDALTDALGSWTNWLLTVIIFMLAFSSILGNYYYGESNIEFITESHQVLTVYRAFVVVAILVGSVLAADLVWNSADQIMGLMALINLVAIALLSGIVFKLLKNYADQRAAGRDPVFTRDQMPELTGIECWEDTESVTGEIPIVRG